jgi:uncharacterized protein (TIGR02246 family)
MSIAQGKPDETIIRNILDEEVTSWNKGDARVYSRHFAEDGTFTNIRGMFFTGHQEFLDKHEEIFKVFFTALRCSKRLFRSGSFARKQPLWRH